MARFLCSAVDSNTLVLRYLGYAAVRRPASSIKSLMSLLRYSAHDADVFLNFSNEFTSQCVHPYINPRTEQDLIADLEETFDNWYKLKKGEDVADACGHICMRLGRCDKAMKFLQVSCLGFQPRRLGLAISFSITSSNT